MDKEIEQAQGTLAGRLAERVTQPSELLTLMRDASSDELMAMLATCARELRWREEYQVRRNGTLPTVETWCRQLADQIFPLDTSWRNARARAYMRAPSSGPLALTGAGERWAEATGRRP